MSNCSAIAVARVYECGSRIARHKLSGLLGMPRAERSNADADEEPGMVAVQIAVFRHVICDVGRLSAEIKFIAHLMTGNDRGLR
jgi:hypothetical protein